MPMPRWRNLPPVKKVEVHARRGNELIKAIARPDYIGQLEVTLDSKACNGCIKHDQTAEHAWWDVLAAKSGEKLGCLI